MIPKVLKSIRKSPPAKNLQHAQTGKPTPNVNQVASFLILPALNKKRFQNRKVSCNWRFAEKKFLIAVKKFAGRKALESKF